MRYRAFFDTNILAYEFDNSAIQKQKVSRELLDNWRPSGFFVISTQVLQEFFVVLTKKFRPSFPYKKAQQLIKMYSQYNVYTNSPDTILKAVELSEHNRLSFWDSLILAAAIESGCRILFTEDMNHGQQIENIKIVNPFIEGR